MDKPVVIIGSGPAGLIAAEILAKAGKSVHIYERKSSPARKFLLAGRGGLNITHSEDIGKFHTRYNEAQEWLSPLIDSFSPADLKTWCEELGQKTFIGSSGRVFPETMKASPLLRAWLARLESLGVKFHYNHIWTGWNGEDLSFTTEGNKPVKVMNASTLLALGGASWPNLGSDGAWTKILEQRGIDVRSLQPTNCGFVVAWSDIFKTRFAGQPLKNITARTIDKTVNGEVMIDTNGIEGGAVYALSSTIRDEINLSGTTTISIDLKPSLSVGEIAKKLQTPRGRQSFSTYLQKTLNLPPIAIGLLREVDMNIGDKTTIDLAALIKSLPVTLIKPFPIERAISTAGGIRLDELDENLMLKKLPDTFAAGEMLDWEAPTGGYLLQACFATGVAAAKGMLKRLK